MKDIVAAIADCKVLNNGINDQFINASVDSRNIQGGELFFALRTDLNDGHKYIRQAIDNGACGVVVMEDINISDFAEVNIIQVEDTFIALNDLSDYIRIKYNPQIIAVTGSVGKTSIKDMTHYIMSHYYKTQKNEASYNNEIGVPLTLLKLKAESTHMITEIGANHIGEVDKLAKLAKPNIAVISKIGYAHIGNFGAIQNTLQAKMEIIDHIQSGGYLIINSDDELLVDGIKNIRTDINIIKIGISQDADLYIDNLKLAADGMSGDIHYCGEKSFFQLNMIGYHNIYTVLFAVAISVINKISLQNVCAALSNFLPTNNRLFMEKLSDDLWLINDYYNSSPDAAISAIKTLKSYHQDISMAVLGDMKELGEFSKYCHELVGNELDLSVSYVFLIGQDVAEIERVCLEKGFTKHKNIFLFDNVHQAKKEINNIIAKHPSHKTILIKGSRFMHLERIAMAISNKEVKCSKESCPKYIHCNNCDEY